MMIIIQPVLSQNWEGSRKTGLWERWAFTVNGGYSSYYGDLSIYDSDISNKIMRESGPAYGAIVSKYLNNIVGISGQILIGNLKGAKENYSFSTDITEYNLQLRINFINLFNNRRDHKFGILGYAGIGQFFYSVRIKKDMEGILISNKYTSAVPEFVVFAGGGVHYIIGKNFSMSANLSLRQCQNDELDGYKHKRDNDYYSYMSMGLTYYIPSFVKHPLRNRARIANSNFKFTASIR